MSVDEWRKGIFEYFMCKDFPELINECKETNVGIGAKSFHMAGQVNFIKAQLKKISYDKGSVEEQVLMHIGILLIHLQGVIMISPRKNHTFLTTFMNKLDIIMSIIHDTHHTENINILMERLTDIACIVFEMMVFSNIIDFSELVEMKFVANM